MISRPVSPETPTDPHKGAGCDESIANTLLSLHFETYDIPSETFELGDFLLRDGTECSSLDQIDVSRLSAEVRDAAKHGAVDLGEDAWKIGSPGPWRLRAVSASGERVDVRNKATLKGALRAMLADQQSPGTLQIVLLMTHIKSKSLWHIAASHN